MPNRTTASHAADIIIDYEEDSYRKQTQEFFHDLPHNIQQYIVNLFPIATWIHRYNIRWLLSDLIAGVTVGIAQLSPQYGL
jgi:hypothetical protein